jgi:hypothetical protein
VRVVDVVGMTTPKAPGSARTHTDFTVCWSDRGRWVPQAFLGQQFKTEEEATAYLDANREQLELAPGLVG